MGSFFQRVFENALQTVAPFLHAFSETLYKQVRRRTSPLLCEPQCYILSYTFLQLSWLASEIQPRATELCSLPLRDQITGRGSNTTQLSCVRFCFLHQLRSVELLNMSVGSDSIICWRAPTILWAAPSWNQIIGRVWNTLLAVSLLSTSAICIAANHAGSEYLHKLLIQDWICCTRSMLWARY